MTHESPENDRMGAPATCKTESTGFDKLLRSGSLAIQVSTRPSQSLRQQILRRDGWRCQSCGSMSNLEVHHREFRSHSGADSEENLNALREVPR